MEIGSNLYHICEFAERMEYGGHTCEPVRDNLPERCYSVLSGSDEIIIIKRGEKGYFKTDIPVTDKDEARSIANEYNAKLGVSKAQEEAMKAGSMFGFQVPAADPRNYDADGKPVMNNGQYVPKDYALLPKEAMTVDDRNMALLQVGLTQPIYMGGKIRAYNQLAGLSEKLAESGREQELQNIIQETDEAYWQIVSLVNRQKLAVKFVETLQKFEHDIEVMYRTGVSTKADMLSVKVKLNQAEMALLRVEDGLSLARMNLNQICGLAVDSVYTLQEELLNVLPQAEPKWLNIEQVYDNRPEISSLTLATDIYRKKEKIARSAYLPTVAFMANYFAMTPSFFDGISTGFDGMWSVGIGVKAPIFHWGASRKTVRSARAETSLMNFKLQEAREKIELQVSQARLKVKEAARKMEVAEKNQVKADENLKYANLGFQEGTIPVSNVLEAQTAWLAAHADLIDTQIEMKLCEVYLQKAYGILGKE